MYCLVDKHTIGAFASLWQDIERDEIATKKRQKIYKKQRRKQKKNELFGAL